jgi:hypothetical protein
VLAECAQPVGNIAQERFKPGQPAAFTNGLARLLHSAKANHGLTAGIFGREAGADAVLRMHLDVAFELGVEVAFFAPACEESTQSNPECS